MVYQQSGMVECVLDVRIEPMNIEANLDNEVETVILFNFKTHACK